MKKYLLLSLLACASCSSESAPETTVTAKTTTVVPAVRPSLIDEKNGFRTYQFGDNVTTIPNLVPLDLPHPAGVTLYKRTPESLQLGTGQLSFIRYDFYQNKLYQVMLVADRANAPQLLSAATALYGPGVQANPQEEHYAWQGQKAAASYQRVAGSGIAALTVSSKAIAEQVEAAKGQAAKGDL